MSEDTRGLRDGFTEGDSGVRARVLVVEDDELFAAVLQRWLGDDLDVRVETSAERALVRLEREEFDVLLTDCDLPGQDGVWLARATRARWPRMRRLLMSSGAVPHAGELVYEGVIDAFIEKLDVPRTLLPCIRRMLGTQ